MITAKELLDAGYNLYTFKDPYKQKLYQRKVCGIINDALYFINFFYWIFPDHSSWSVEVHLYKKDCSFELNLRISDNTTLEDVESFYEDAFNKLNCVPDKDNN